MLWRTDKVIIMSKYDNGSISFENLRLNAIGCFCFIYNVFLSLQVRAISRCDVRGPWTNFTVNLTSKLKQLFAFDCVGSVWTFSFFIPAITANDLWLWKISIPNFIHFFFLNSWERASISFSMLSAKQGNYWYHFYNVFGMTRSLTGDWT